MRNDVHLEALKAAARVAFSVAFLGGCAAAGGDGAHASESDLSSKAKKKKPGTSSTNAGNGDAPCQGVGTTTPKPLSCDLELASAFPTPSNYPGDKKTISKEVETCCVEMLASNKGVGSEHRWDCCANVDPTKSDQKIGLACTPWGPPVPPSMKRRARPADAWIMQGVA